MKGREHTRRNIITIYSTINSDLTEQIDIIRQFRRLCVFSQPYHTPKEQCPANVKPDLLPVSMRRSLLHITTARVGHHLESGTTLQGGRHH